MSPPKPAELDKGTPSTSSSAPNAVCHISCPPSPAVLVALGLAFITFVVYSSVSRHDFINFDDRDYVVENPPVLSGLNARSIAWAFTAAHSANWHPLTWISHMLDVQLFGLNAGWHHLTSLILHVINGLLLFGFLWKTTGARWRSAFAAALFLLHPCHVESVAWIAERKDVLSAFFLLLTLWAYARYAEYRPSATAADPQVAAGAPKAPLAQYLKSKRLLWYLAALICFALGLMSKPMLVTLPFVLLLVDIWPLRRLQLEDRAGFLRDFKPLLLEKVPLFILTILSSVMTFVVQRNAGAISPLDALTLGQRAGNAMVAYARYVGKIFWPSNLAVYYPHPGSWPKWIVIGAGLLLVVLTTLALLRHRQPVLMVGWLWFLGTLVPVIGLVQVGSQSIADRYTYIPSIGIFLAVAWALPDALVRQPAWRTTLAVGGIIILGTCGWASAKQVSHWKNSETLFAHALRVTADNHMTRFCLANALADNGRMQEAVEQLERAAQLKPSFPNIYGKLGYILNAQEQYAAALARYRQALEHDPELPEALNNLAWLLATCPDPALRNGSEAVSLGQKACERTKYRKTLYVGTLAAAYAEAGQFDQAIATAERARSNALYWREEKLVERNAQLLELYRQGKAFHEAHPPQETK